MQVEHQATDSVTVGFYDKFARFLVESENTPDTLAELRRNFIKLVVTGSKDPDQARGEAKALRALGANPHHIKYCPV